MMPEYPTEQAPATEPFLEMENAEAIEIEAEIAPSAIDPEYEAENVREDVAKELSSMITTYENDEHRQWHLRAWRSIYRAYNGMYNERRYDGKLIVRVMEIFRQVETLKPQLSAQFFGGYELFNYLPRFEGFEDQAAAATRIVHTQVDQFKVRSQLEMWKDVALVYGTSFLVPSWKKFRKVKRKIKPLYAAHQTKGYEKISEEILEEGPYLDRVDPWDLVADPWVEDPRESPLASFKRWVSHADLLSLCAEGFLDRDACEAACGDNEAPSGATHMPNEAPAQWGSQQHRFKNDTPQLLEICWTNDGMEFGLLNRKNVARAKRLKGGVAPLYTLKNYPQPGELWGKGEPLIILNEQKMLDEFYQMFMDTVKFGAGMFKVVSGSGSEKRLRETNFKVGGILPVDKMDDVGWIESNGKHMELGNALGMVKQSMQLTTGVTPEMSGSGSSTKTATGIVRLQDAAGARIEHKVRLMTPVFQEVYAALFELNAEYLDDDVAVRMVGEDGRRVFSRYGAEVFAAEIDVEVRLANMLETGPEAQNKWGMALKLLGNDPIIDPLWVREKFIRAMGEKNPKLAFASSQTAQADAMLENQTILALGVLPSVKARDNHQLHLQIHSMFVQTLEFQTLPEQYKREFAMHMAQHQGFLEMQMQANAQMQMQATGGQGQPGPGATGAGPEANARAESMFNNAQTGAMQG